MATIAFSIFFLLTLTHMFGLNDFADYQLLTHVRTPSKKRKKGREGEEKHVGKHNSKITIVVTNWCQQEVGGFNFMVKNSWYWDQKCTREQKKKTTIRKRCQRKESWKLYKIIFVVIVLFLTFFFYKNKL